MNIDKDCLISISEAERNFSKVARTVDEKGSAVILKNNKPRYLVMGLSGLEQLTVSDNDVKEISDRLIRKNLEAYKELAK